LIDLSCDQVVCAVDGFHDVAVGELGDAELAVEVGDLVA
jgi:hypothetical protein